MIGKLENRQSLLVYSNEEKVTKGLGFHKVTDFMY